MLDAIEPATMMVEIELSSDNLYHTQISLGDGKPGGITVDTGSTGIVISRDRLPSDLKPMKNPPPYEPKYTSSGNSYTGYWYSVTVSFSDSDGDTAIAEELPVFGVEESGVAMMGIGLSRPPITDNQPNPFANITKITVDGKDQSEIHQGYVFTSKGITLGLTDDVIDGFGKTYDIKDFKATVTLTPATDNKDAKSQSVDAPLLVDSGINYMIINPGIKKDSDAPAGYEDAKTGQFAPGTTIALNTSGMSYSFKTGTDASNPDEAPAYVRWGSSPTGHLIINTGRHAFLGLDLLVDAENEQYGLKAAQN